MCRDSNSTPDQDKASINKWLNKERDTNKQADEYNDKKGITDDGQWPEWYRRARK